MARVTDLNLEMLRTISKLKKDPRFLTGFEPRPFAIPTQTLNSKPFH